MRKNNVLKQVIISVLSLGLVLTMIPNVVKAEEGNYESHSISTGEFNILNSEYKQTQILETEEGTWTFTIEDVESDMPTISPRYSQNWGTGTFDKRVKANFEGTDDGGNSIFAKMSARFAGSINPYVARITLVDDGDFNATIITPINGTERYEITKPSATPSDYAAEARFRQKYSIPSPFGSLGQHDMCLYLQVKPNGTAYIFMQGIW